MSLTVCQATGDRIVSACPNDERSSRHQPIHSSRSRNGARPEQIDVGLTMNLSKLRYFHEKRLSCK